MDLEFRGDCAQGLTLGVPVRCGGDLLVSHLADIWSALHVAIVEVAQHRCAVDVEVAGEFAHAQPARVLGDELVDLDRGEPSLHRV